MSFHSDMLQQKDMNFRQFHTSFPILYTSGLADPASAGHLRISIIISRSKDICFCRAFNFEEHQCDSSATTSSRPVNQYNDYVTEHLYILHERLWTVCIDLILNDAAFWTANDRLFHGAVNALNEKQPSCATVL